MDLSDQVKRTVNLMNGLDETKKKLDDKLGVIKTVKLTT